jgi:hypothetical protein
MAARPRRRRHRGPPTEGEATGRQVAGALRVAGRSFQRVSVPFRRLGGIREPRCPGLCRRAERRRPVFDRSAERLPRSAGLRAAC